MFKNIAKIALAAGAIYGLRKIYKAYKDDENVKNKIHEAEEFAKDGFKKGKQYLDESFDKAHFSQYYKEHFGEHFHNDLVDKDGNFTLNRILKNVLDSKNSVDENHEYIEYIKEFRRLFSALSEVQNAPYGYNVSYLKRLHFNIADIDAASGLFKGDLDEIYKFIEARCDGFENLVARKSDFKSFDTKQRILFENLYLVYGALIGMMEYLETKSEYTDSISQQLRNMLKELEARV